MVPVSIYIRALYLRCEPRRLAVATLRLPDADRCMRTLRRKKPVSYWGRHPLVSSWSSKETGVIVHSLGRIHTARSWARGWSHAWALPLPHDACSYQRCVCVISYLLTATCGPKGHGSGLPLPSRAAAEFYQPTSCPRSK